MSVLELESGVDEMPTSPDSLGADTTVVEPNLSEAAASVSRFGGSLPLTTLHPLERGSTEARVRVPTEEETALRNHTVDSVQGALSYVGMLLIQANKLKENRQPVSSIHMKRAEVAVHVLDMLKPRVRGDGWLSTIEDGLRRGTLMDTGRKFSYSAPDITRLPEVGAYIDSIRNREAPGITTIATPDDDVSFIAAAAEHVRSTLVPDHVDRAEA